MKSYYNTNLYTLIPAVCFICFLNIFCGVQNSKAEVAHYEIDSKLSELQIVIVSGSEKLQAQEVESDMSSVSGTLSVEVKENSLRILGSDIIPEKSGQFFPASDGSEDVELAQYGFFSKIGNNSLAAALRNVSLSLLHVESSLLEDDGSFSTTGLRSTFNTGQIVMTSNTHIILKEDLTGKAHDNINEQNFPTNFHKTGLYKKYEQSEVLFIPFYVEIPAHVLHNGNNEIKLIVLGQVGARRSLPEDGELTWSRIRFPQGNDPKSYFAEPAQEGIGDAFFSFQTCFGGSHTPVKRYLPLLSSDFNLNFSVCPEAIALDHSWFTPLVINNKLYLLTSCIDIAGKETRSIIGNPFMPDQIFQGFMLYTPQKYVDCNLEGDYNRDGKVDMQDYLVFKMTYGEVVLQPGNGADGNDNGIIDLADYTVWRDNIGNGSY